MTAPARSHDLPPQFDPAAIERGIYKRWLEAGAFRADATRSRRLGGDRLPYTLVIPPPNVTGILHMGHGLNNTVQDVITRWRRMCGDETLWLPGTDHAGIATQNVVERLIDREEGKTRFDYGREAFVARVVRFVADTGGTILTQLASIGASCDWSRTAYTLSPELSRAVREAFVHLYDKGLIYRGHRVIHWCPRCLTSLSDEEAEHEEAIGTLYQIRYPLPGGSTGGIVVATTRPETMLGDVAVAVHPDDPRYRDFVGRRVRLPIAEVEIPVIADAVTDPSFGTGAVKITPAHDANDFEVGVRHGLAMPVVITPTGTMAEGTDAAGRVPEALRGLDRLDARARIAEMLETAGLLVGVATHPHAIRRCYRCDTVVEPRLSDQWFVRMAPLARPALDAVRRGEIRILPERWVGVYTNWMENIRDWNISRQLWWGHRIPVWYCDACEPPGNTVASREDLAVCPTCGGPVRQDEDVLDTWFSSWLWPFSTLGWPDREATDLAAFYPTDLLVTAPEILFFWVARMIMAGYEFMGDRPFHTVYLHGTARDPQHRRMSKSLGNGVDPLDVVRLYGADALRYTLVAGMGLGADLILDPTDLEKSFTPGRNFATKLWNVGRFLLVHVGEDAVPALEAVDSTRLTRADAWVLERLEAAIAECDAALGPARPPGGPESRTAWPPGEWLAGLRLNEYVESVRRFVWNELADWYVESAKARLTPDAEDRDVARAVLVHVFDAALRLMHPVVPFITEALWQRLPGRAPDELLIRASWPRPDRAQRAAAGGRAQEFQAVQEAVMAIRQLRSEYQIPPGQMVEVLLVSHDHDAGAVVAEEAALIARLARATVRSAATAPRTAAAHAVLADGTELVMPVGGLIDVAKECARLHDELGRLDAQIGTAEGRLTNTQFTSKAPPHVVEATRAKARDLAARREQLALKVAALCGGG